MAQTSSSTRPVEFSLENDLECVEAQLQGGVRSTLELPFELAQRLVLAGGKRIRPYLMCLSYHSLGAGLAPRVTREDLHTLAAVAEWVHTATLFHDDVLDASPARRNLPAAHTLHGNKISILVGDFVYAEAFALLMDRGLLEASRDLASTIKSLVEGELLQHQISLDRSLRLEDYDRIAQAKTAALFAWCTATGAWAANCPKTSAARAFGNALGFAFQMADDLFDTYSLNPATADPKELEEWAESAPPLPLVMAAQTNPRIADIWQAPAATVEVVSELQRHCRRKEVIDACLSRIRRVLREADGLLHEMGNPRGLRSALEVITDRSVAGAQAADPSLKSLL